MEFMKEEFKMEKDMKIEREKSLIEQAFIFFSACFDGHH